MQKRHLIFLFCFYLLSSLSLMTCGGSNSSSSTSTTNSTLSLQGTVKSPSSSSSQSLVYSNDGLVAYITESNASNVDVSIYNVTNPPANALPIATATTDENGKWSADVSSASPGDKLIVEASNNIKGLVTISATQNTTTSYNVGDVDLKSTLAVQELTKQLKSSGVTVTDWSTVDLDTVDAGFDLKCFTEMLTEKWRVAEPTAQGTAGGIAAIKDMMAAAMITGSYTEHGYSTFDEMSEALIDGTLSSDYVTQLAQETATHIGGNVSTYSNGYVNAARDSKSVSNTFKTHYAGGKGAGVSSSVNSQFAVVEASSGTFCGDMQADKDLVKQSIETMLSASNIQTFAKSFGCENCVDKFYDTMKKYKTPEGDYTFDNTDADADGNPDKWNPKAFAGMMEFYGTKGNWDSWNPAGPPHENSRKQGIR